MVQEREFIKVLSEYSKKILELPIELRRKYIDYVINITSDDYLNIGGNQLGYFKDNVKLSEMIPKDKIVVDAGCGYAWQQILFKDHKRYIGIQKFAPQNIGPKEPKIEAIFPNATILQKRFRDVDPEEIGWTEESKHEFFGVANHSLWHNGLEGLNLDRELFKKYFPINYYATDDASKEIDYLMSGLPERRKNILNEIKKIEFDSILETGCDKGGNMEWIIKYFPNVKKYGCDVSEQDIEYSKKYFPEFEIKFGNVRDLPYEDNSIDVVICDAVLYQFEIIPQEIDRIIGELERVAKKMIVICDPNAEDYIVRLREKKEYKFIRVNEGNSWEKGGIITWTK